MRTHKIGSITIDYPDELCFAFNPQYVAVTTSVDVTTTISGNGKEYKDKRSPFNGKARIDISSYLRSLFSIDNKELVTSTLATVNIETNESVFTFTTNCIWGAINIGEVFNAGRKVTWFHKFPFTFSMYIPAGSSLRTRFDRNKYSSIDAGTGVVNLLPSDIFQDAKDMAVFRLDTGDSDGGVFAMTFDYTFKKVGDGTVINHLIIDDSECGVYLRWIDRHGFYQYYLFKNGDKVSQSANEGELIYQDHNDLNFTYDGVSRYQGKTMKNTIKACATLVDKDAFNMLSTLHSSPLIDLYIDGNWVPVNIVAGSFTNTGADLQDFEIQITMPETITQML